MKSPTPEQIKAERARQGLLQREAAERMGYTLRQWQNFEGGKTPMKPIIWQVFKRGE